MRGGSSSALDRVFSQVDRAIVLEDDVCAAPSFFPFCDEMLERYADDERVVHVDGNNRLGEWRPEAHDYHFARHANVWGWATWARAWARYDSTADRYRSRSTARRSPRTASTRPRPRSSTGCSTAMSTRWTDEWDHQWALARYATGGLTVVPARNLTTNVGFGAHATHTKQPDELAAATRASSLDPPFEGPADVVADDDLDRELLRFERLRSFREATVPSMLVRAMTDPRVRGRLAPNPAVANALAALEDPDAALALLHTSARTGAPSSTRDRLIDEFERLLALQRRAEATSP